MKKTIKITACNNKDCGSSTNIDLTPWWGSREGIKAGENKTIRVTPTTIGRLELKKAA